MRPMKLGNAWRVALVIGLVVSVCVGAAPSAKAASNYSDAAYRRHDIDNVARSTTGGRQRAYATNPAYDRAFTPAAAESFLANVGRQVTDLPHGRLYATLGQLLPGGSVGDPTKYHQFTPTTIEFVSRTGAKLVGRLWTDGKPGLHPAIVITPGSIQGTQHMYFWAARSLAAAGYLVMSFDAQGQGESETFGHAPGESSKTTAGFPFQQAPNFIDGTVDALRFLYSTSNDPYVPGTWSRADAAKARKADGTLSFVNPLTDQLDRTRLGLAGHSAGAGAVSVVQQCSDAATLWKTLAVCTGRSFPIKAIVGWDGVSSTDIVPVVPAMDQRADGYFLNPQLTYTAPDPKGHLESFRAWAAKGIDAYAFSVRGGTHVEWVDVPYILPSTTYGVRLADHYTQAWFERYVNPNPAVRDAASRELLRAPKRVTGSATQAPWRADFFSARYLSAFAFHNAAGQLVSTSDLRQYGNASRVGDWAGANADKPKAAD